MKYNNLIVASLLAACPLLAFGDEPTFTFGPASKYLSTRSTTATPTGDNLVISPSDVSAGIPSTGMDFLFGPDQQSAMDKTLQGTCAHGASQDCMNELTNIIDNRNTFSLQARVVGVDSFFSPFVMSGIIVAVGFAYLFNAPKPVTGVHFEAEELAQLQSFTTTPFIYATSSGAPPLTYSSVQTPTITISSASITTASADASKYHSGDIVLSLPSHPAMLIKQLIALNGGPNSCKNTTSPNKASNKMAAGNNTVSTDLKMIRSFKNATTASSVRSIGDNRSSTGSSSTRVANLPSTASTPIDLGNNHTTNNSTESKNVGMQRNSTSHNKPATLAALKGSGMDNFANIDRITHLAEYVIPMAAPGRVLAALGLQAQQHLPALRDAVNQAALEQFQLLAGRLEVFRDVAEDFVHLIAEVVWLTTYEVCTKSLDDIAEIILEEWMFEDPKDEGDEVDKECRDDPMEYPRCSDASCIGIGPQIGLAPRCSVGTEQFCPCLPEFQPLGYPGSRSLLDAGQDFLIEMLEGPSGGRQVQGGTLVCGNSTDQGFEGIFTTLDTMNKAADSFCQEQVKQGYVFAPGKSPVTHSELHYNNQKVDPVYVSLDWDDDGDCPTFDFTQSDARDKCNQRLGVSINSCDTSNDKGYKFWKQGGTYTRDCITWTMRRNDWLAGYWPPNS